MPPAGYAPHLRCLGLAAALLFVALPDVSSAQYFGANKVQYRRQDFRVLATDHFDIYFYQDEREAADTAGRLAERWRARFARFFGRALRGRQPLILYASAPDFEQTQVVDDHFAIGTRGFTEPVRRRMVLPFAGPIADTAHVIGHELVHAFQFECSPTTADT